MTYKTELRPWAIFCCRVSGNICVARYRTCGDACAYLSLLRGRNPGEIYQVVFDQSVEVKR